MIAFLAALTLLVLAGGSVLMLVMFLAEPPGGPRWPDEEIGIFFATRLVWPLTLLLTGVFGVATFLAAGRPAYIFVLVLGLFSAYCVVLLTLHALTAISTYRLPYHLPLRGLLALLCILLFLGVNAAAVYSAWYLVFGPA